MPQGNKAYVIIANFSGQEVAGGAQVNATGAAVVLAPEGTVLVAPSDNLVAFGGVGYGDSNHDIQARLAADVVARAQAEFGVTVGSVEFVTG